MKASILKRIEILESRIKEKDDSKIYRFFAHLFEDGVARTVLPNGKEIWCCKKKMVKKLRKYHKIKKEGKVLMIFGRCWDTTGSLYGKPIYGPKSLRKVRAQDTIYKPEHKYYDQGE